MTYFHDRRDTRTQMDEEKIPPVLIKGMFGLVLLCLALVTVHVLTDQPVVSMPPASAVTDSREIVITGDMGGRAQVAAPDGRVIADLTAEEGGFVSGVARVIARERGKYGLPNTAPVTLVRRENGRLSLHDPLTGWQADLMGFGLDNARAFARLLYAD